MRAEARELLLRLLGRLEELIAIGHVLAATPREVDVMRGLVPRAPHLGVEVRARRHDDQRVRREEIGDGAARRAVVVLARAPVHRKDHGARPHRACERCVARSKWRSEEISSPHSSRRTGFAIPKL